MVVWKMMFLYAMEHVVDFILVFGGVWLDIFIFVLGIGWRRSWISMAVGLWLWFNMINPSAGPDSCGEESLSLSLSLYTIFGFIYVYIYICIENEKGWKRICCSPPIWAAAFQGGLEGTCQQGITTAQNDLISYSNSLRWTDPKNLP